MKNPHKLKTQKARKLLEAEATEAASSCYRNSKPKKCTKIDHKNIVRMNRRRYLFAVSTNNCLFYTFTCYFIFICIMCACVSKVKSEPSSIDQQQERPTDSSSFKPKIDNCKYCSEHLFQNDTKEIDLNLTSREKAKSLNLPTVDLEPSKTHNSTYKTNHTLTNSIINGHRNEIEELEDFEPVNGKYDDSQSLKKYEYGNTLATNKPSGRQKGLTRNNQQSPTTTSTTFSPTLKQLFDDDEEFDMMAGHNLSQTNNLGMTSNSNQWTNRSKAAADNSVEANSDSELQFRSGLKLPSSLNRNIKPEAGLRHIVMANAPILRVVSNHINPEQALVVNQQVHTNKSNESKMLNHLTGKNGLIRDKHYQGNKIGTILKFSTFPQLYYDAIKIGNSKSDDKELAVKNRHMFGGKESSNMRRKQNNNLQVADSQDLSEQEVADSQTEEPHDDSQYKEFTAASLIPDVNSADELVEVDELSPLKNRGFSGGGYWSQTNNKGNDHSLWTTINGFGRKGTNNNSNDNYLNSKTKSSEKAKSQFLKPVLLKSDVKVRSELVFENNNNSSGIDGLADKKLSGSAATKQSNSSSSFKRLEATSNSDNSMFKRISLPAQVLFELDDEKFSDDLKFQTDSSYKSYFEPNGELSSGVSDMRNQDQQSLNSFDRLSNPKSSVGEYELLSKRDEGESYLDLVDKSNSWPYANYLRRKIELTKSSNTASPGIRVTTGEGPAPLVINKSGLIVAAKSNATGKPYNHLSLTNQISEHSLNPIKINGNIHVYETNHSISSADDNIYERPTFLKKPLIISDTIWTKNSTNRPDLIKQQTSYNILSPLEQQYHNNYTHDHGFSLGNKQLTGNKHSYNEINGETNQSGETDDIGNLAKQQQQQQHQSEKRYPNKTQSPAQSLYFHHNPPYKHHLSDLSQKTNIGDQQTNCTTTNQSTTLTPTTPSSSSTIRPKQNTRHPDQNRRTSPPNLSQSTDRISYELSTSQSQHQSNRFPMSSTSSLVNGLSSSSSSSSTTPLYELSSSTTNAPIEFSSNLGGGGGNNNHNSSSGSGANNHGHTNAHHHHAITPSILSNFHPNYSINLNSTVPMKPSKIRNKLQHIIIGKILKSQLNNSMVANAAAATINQQMAASQQYLAYQAPSTPPPLLSSTVANNVANLLAQKLNSLVRPYQPLSGLNSLFGIRVGSSSPLSSQPPQPASPQTTVINRFKQRINPFATQTHSSINRRTTGVGSLLMSGFVYGLTVLPALMALTGINPLSTITNDTTSQAGESGTSGGLLSMVTNRHGDSEKRSKRLNSVIGNSNLGPLLTHDADPLSSYAYLVPFVPATAPSLDEDLSLPQESLPSLEQPQQQSTIIKTIQAPPNNLPIGSNSLASNLLSDIHPLLDDPTIGQLSPTTTSQTRFNNHHLAAFSAPVTPTSLHGSPYVPSASNLWLERVAPADQKQYQALSNSNNNYWQQQSQTLDNDGNIGGRYNLTEIRKPFGYDINGLTQNQQLNLYNLDNFIGSSSSQKKQIFGRGISNDNNNNRARNLVDNQHYLISNNQRQSDLNLNPDYEQQTTSAPLLPFIVPIPIKLHDSNHNFNQPQQTSLDQFSNDKKAATSQLPQQANQQQLQHAIKQISMSPSVILSSLLFGTNAHVSPPIRSSDTLNQRQQVSLGLNDHHHNHNHLSNKRQPDENHQEQINFPTGNHLRFFPSKLEQQQQKYHTNIGADNIVVNPYSNSNSNNNNNIEGNTISALNSIDHYLNNHRRRRTPSNLATTYRPSSGETELRPVIITRPIKRPHFRGQLLSPLEITATGANMYAPTKAKLAKEKIIQKRPDSLSQIVANGGYQVGYTLNYTPITPPPLVQATMSSAAAADPISKHQSSYLVPSVSSQNLNFDSNNKKWRAVLPSTSSQSHIANNIPSSLDYSHRSYSNNKDQHDVVKSNPLTSSSTDRNNQWIVTGTSLKSVKPNLKVRFGNLKPAQNKKKRKQNQTTTKLPDQLTQDGESELLLSHTMAMGSKVANEHLLDVQR